MSNINLIYLPMPKLKTTTISVYVYRSLNEKEASQNAILPYVLKQGCKLCPDMESVSKYLENLYGAAFEAGVSKFGDIQYWRFEAQSISDRYAAEGEPLTEELLKLVLSAMFEPVTENGGFLSRVVDIEKKNAKDRIMSEMNDKRMYAIQHCAEAMCAGEAYSISKYGTQEGIDAAEPRGLYEYYRNAIVSSVIDIYVCGEADEAELNRIIEEKTAGIEFKEAEKTEIKIHKKSRDVKRITDKMDVTQGTLAMGFVTNIEPDSDEAFAQMVMHSIFGSGAHAKLMNNVREKLSLAYYAAAMLIKAKGIMVVNAGIDFENFQKTYDETLVQLEALKNGEVTEHEYKSSISFIINNLESMKDSPEQMHGFMSQQRALGTNYDIDYVKKKVSEVTLEEAVKAAQNVELDTVYFLTGGKK